MRAGAAALRGAGFQQPKASSAMSMGVPEDRAVRKPTHPGGALCEGRRFFETYRGGGSRLGLVDLDTAARSALVRNAALDQKQVDKTTMTQIFADNAKVTRPNGSTMIGPKEIGDSHSHSLSRFRATQHLTSGFIITPKESTTAEFRVNLVAMHLWAEGEGDPNVDPSDNYFLAGAVITGYVTLGTDGWRIAELANEPAWLKGTGFQQMLKTR
jgi:hypothetical protein